ncbi:MAG: hypothetical protein E6J00_01955 [Chloroflexi bacterium]|nr:MAG: hypothetical protein E6J00_01955 [Chloroflexota bacterium]
MPLSEPGLDGRHARLVALLGRRLRLPPPSGPALEDDGAAADPPLQDALVGEQVEQLLDLLPPLGPELHPADHLVHRRGFGKRANQAAAVRHLDHRPVEDGG